MEINSVGTQQPTLPTNVQEQTVATQADASGLASEADQLSEAAETAFASLFFSMLQNILGEAQKNSGS